jgi:hypothetical protein
VSQHLSFFISRKAFRSMPGSERYSGNPTVADRRGACGNVDVARAAVLSRPINSIRGFFKTVSLHLAFIEVYVTPGCSGADTTPNGRYATMRTIDPRNLVEKR